LREKEAFTAVSSTVSKVIDECVTEMRGDPEIDASVVNRFEKLLKRGTVPNPEELIAALLDSSPDG
jgi:hypothetical protein